MTTISNMPFGFPKPYQQVGRTQCRSLQKAVPKAACTIHLKDLWHPTAPANSPRVVFSFFDRSGGLSYTLAVLKFAIDPPHTKTLVVFNSNIHLVDQHGKMLKTIPITCYQRLNPKSLAACAMAITDRTIIMAIVPPSSSAGQVADCKTAMGLLDDVVAELSTLHG